MHVLEDLKGTKSNCKTVVIQNCQRLPAEDQSLSNGWHNPQQHERSL